MLITAYATYLKTKLKKKKNHILNKFFHLKKHLHFKNVKVLKKRYNLASKKNKVINVYPDSTTYSLRLTKSILRIRSISIVFIYSDFYINTAEGQTLECDTLTRTMGSFANPSWWPVHLKWMTCMSGL